MELITEVPAYIANEPGFIEIICRQDSNVVHNLYYPLDKLLLNPVLQTDYNNSLMFNNKQFVYTQFPSFTMRYILFYTDPDNDFKLVLINKLRPGVINSILFAADYYQVFNLKMILLHEISQRPRLEYNHVTVKYNPNMRLLFYIYFVNNDIKFNITQNIIEEICDFIKLEKLVAVIKEYKLNFSNKILYRINIDNFNNIINIADKLEVHTIHAILIKYAMHFYRDVKNNCYTETNGKIIINDINIVDKYLRRLAGELLEINTKYNVYNPNKKIKLQ